MAKSLKQLRAELKKKQAQLNKIGPQIVKAHKAVHALENQRNKLETDISNLEWDIDCTPDPAQKIRKGYLKKVYKKVYGKGNGYGGTPYIAILSIPAKAQRSQDEDEEMKCRASEAKVLRIESLDGKKMVKKAYSKYDKSFTYTVGKTVTPREEFDTSGDACASGIHFFMTREQAVNY